MALLGKVAKLVMITASSLPSRRSAVFDGATDDGTTRPKSNRAASWNKVVRFIWSHSVQKHRRGNGPQKFEETSRPAAGEARAMKMRLLLLPLCSLRQID